MWDEQPMQTREENLPVTVEGTSSNLYCEMREWEALYTERGNELQRQFKFCCLFFFFFD